MSLYLASREQRFWVQFDLCISLTITCRRSDSTPTSICILLHWLSNQIKSSKPIRVLRSVLPYFCSCSAAFQKDDVMLCLVSTEVKSWNSDPGSIPATPRNEERSWLLDPGTQEQFPDRFCNEQKSILGWQAGRSLHKLIPKRICKVLVMLGWVPGRKLTKFVCSQLIID